LIRAFGGHLSRPEQQSLGDNRVSIGGAPGSKKEQKMSDSSDNNGSRFWKWPKSKWLLGIPIGGFVMLLIGAAGLQIMNTVLHETSTTEFCNSCHSHTNNTMEEHAISSHYQNKTGVRAECHSCHLPSMEDEWFDYVIYKMIVSLDIIAEIQGKITSPEAYEEHRPEMFEKVVREFKDNDSKFCRNCHKAESMQLESQGRLARERHTNMAERGQTCIDCHYGLVHKMPENYDEILKKVQADYSADGG